MKAITEWEELKGKTIVDVIDEEILVFSDDTYIYIEAECDGRCGLVELRDWDLGGAEKRIAQSQV